MNEADNVQCGHTSWLTGFHLGVFALDPTGCDAQSVHAVLNPEQGRRSWTGIRIRLLESGTGLSEAFHEAHVRLFCNGYEVKSTEGGILRAYVPAPGVFVVHGPDDMAASLFCAEEEVENDEDQLNQWIALDNRRIQLTRSTDHQGSGALYCLQITDQDEVAASHRAAGYLDIDLKAELEREFQQRLPFFQAHDGTANNPAMVVAVETLVAHLNPAGEEFSGRWLGDQLSENPLLATQHLLSAIATWNLIDVTISKERAAACSKPNSITAVFMASMNPAQRSIASQEPGQPSPSAVVLSGNANKTPAMAWWILRTTPKSCPA